jgi:hypothetical protein
MFTDNTSSRRPRLVACLLLCCALLTLPSLFAAASYGAPSQIGAGVGPRVPALAGEHLYPLSDPVFSRELFSLAASFAAPQSTPPALPALFVVGSTTLNGGDAAVKSRLEGLGFTVTVKEAASSATSDASGRALVLISETILSTNVGTKFRDVTTPVMVAEAALFDDMQMTGVAQGTDFENQQGQTQVLITNATHPMAAGLSGAVTVATSATGLAWGSPGAGAAKVASLAADSNRQVLFGYESGAPLVGGMSAPARRVGVVAQSQERARDLL